MILFPYPPKSTDSPVNVNPRIGTSVLARRRTDKDNSVLLLFCEDVGGGEGTRVEPQKWFENILM